MHAIDGAAIAALVTLIAGMLALGDLGLATSISALLPTEEEGLPRLAVCWGSQGAWLVSSSARMR